MSLDFETLDRLRVSHPAWRLLRAEQAPLVASFFDRVFIKTNIRVMAQSDLAEKLEDELFILKDQGHKFPRTALEYLNDWAANDKGWLRKFYTKESDEPHFDLTPSTEKAITWLNSLAERSFVGTESKLLTLFQLLKQIVEGSDADVGYRLSELEKRKREIEAEIQKLNSGSVDLLNDTAVKDRFQQFTFIAKEILSDFREVEHNFRGLDRTVRERIALHSGSKGELLAEIIGDRDAITSSDQGRSFQAFWSFLMSRAKQDELSRLLEKSMTLPPVQALLPDPRLSRVHYDWLAAGEHTQETVRLLSQQLRSFLDDAIWLENRRIIEILQSIEAKAIEMREMPKESFVMHIAVPSAELDLPMERKLYSPSAKPRFANKPIGYGNPDIDLSELFELSIVDKLELEKHIRRCLQEQSQIGLPKLIEKRPLEHGLAEILTYFQLATETFESVINETAKDSIILETLDGVERVIQLPQVLFVR